MNSAAKTLILREWARKQPPDSQHMYQEIEEATSLQMNEANKARLRLALQYEGVEFTTIHGIGITLAGPQTGAEILMGQFQKTRRRVERTHTCYDNINSRHLKKMSEDDKKLFAQTGAAFAAIQTALDGFKVTTDMRSSTAFIPKLFS